MTRSIRLPIAPATATTCSGYGRLCDFAIVSPDAGQSCRYACAIFRPTFLLRNDSDDVYRWPECIAAEVER